MLRHEIHHNCQTDGHAIFILSGNIAHKMIDKRLTQLKGHNDHTSQSSDTKYATAD